MTVLVKYLAGKIPGGSIHKCEGTWNSTADEIRQLIEDAEKQARRRGKVVVFCDKINCVPTWIS
jgi:hypothetical protein